MTNKYNVLIITFTLCKRFAFTNIDRRPFTLHGALAEYSCQGIKLKNMVGLKIYREA